MRHPVSNHIQMSGENRESKANMFQLEWRASELNIDRSQRSSNCAFNEKRVNKAEGSLLNCKRNFWEN